jgi:hypothetical protein
MGRKSTKKTLNEVDKELKELMDTANKEGFTKENNMTTKTLKPNKDAEQKVRDNLKKHGLIKQSEKERDEQKRQLGENILTAWEEANIFSRTKSLGKALLCFLGGALGIMLANKMGDKLEEREDMKNKSTSDHIIDGGLIAGTFATVIGSLTGIFSGTFHTMDAFFGSHPLTAEQLKEARKRRLAREAKKKENNKKQKGAA